MRVDLLSALLEPQAVMEVGASEPARHPVLACLGRKNTAPSRETYLRRLNVVARLLTGDTLEPLHLPWHQLTYVELMAGRVKLTQTSAMQTTNVTLYAVKRVLKECFRLGDMSAEEYQRAADVPKVSGTRLPVGRALETSELAQLLNSCAHDRRQPLGARDAAAVGLLNGLGLRSSEVISLDLGDYDEMAGVVRVIGKGNKDRELPVPEAIADVLNRWLEIRSRWSGPFLTRMWRHNTMTKTRLDRRSINVILKRRPTVAKVEHFTPHDMRRTFISTLLDGTVDLATVQALAGHSDPKIMASYDRRGMWPKQAAMGKLSFPA
jgi:site-specific recombinase XerD